MSAKTKRRAAKNRFHRQTQPGAPPGLIVPDPAAQPSHVSALAFGPEGFLEEPIRDLRRQIPPLLEKWPITWINVDGLGDPAVIQEIGAIFNLHKLALEDVVNTHQRAKAEQYGSTLFVVGQMPMPQRAWETEQLSLFVGPNFVISFQERAGGDCLEPVRLRIRTGLTRGKTLCTGHLLYSLLDALVDNYFPLLEECGERLDVLEDDVLSCPDRSVIARILAVKRDLRMIRRAVWPLRDAVNSLLRDPSPLIPDETRVYLRDCHDHIIQILDLVENYRELAANLTDVHLSTLNANTNEVMRVLTIISTVFIPLTFIVGVYGMNFDPDASPLNMPELRMYYGYPAIMIFMAVVALLLVYSFWRRGWLRRRTSEKDG